MKKRGSKKIRELKLELRYFQERARIDERSLRSSRAKCKEIGVKLREAQKERDNK